MENRDETAIKREAKSSKTTRSKKKSQGRMDKKEEKEI